MVKQAGVPDRKEKRLQGRVFWALCWTPELDVLRDTGTRSQIVSGPCTTRKSQGVSQSEHIPGCHGSGEDC